MTDPNVTAEGHPMRLNGAPVESDAHSLTVGNDGPILLHDVHLVEQLAHFNRERVPERSPHAKGSGAFGVFETTEDVSAYTKAAVFQPGAKTRMLARFSTVAGEQGSPDTWRDVRGFSLRFYTEEGILDMVGNNTPVFFMRDPLKFPHFIRSQKRLTDRGLRSAEMQWDFWTGAPETSHQVTYLMGDRGLPRSWRHMNGYSSHTYQWINASGERFWVKYHFHTDQGVQNLTNEDAEELAGKDADYHRRDLFDNIAEGNFPSWTLSMQIMPEAEAKDYKINPFDLTKVWPHKDYPLVKVGTMTLNENPTNFFAEIEQAAFSPSNIVPGTGISPDKMLQARVFAYPDAARDRVGTNFHQLPINRPDFAVNNWAEQGHMQYLHTGDAPNYGPNTKGREFRDVETQAENTWDVEAAKLTHGHYTLRPEDDDTSQAGNLVREVFDDAGRERLVETVTDTLLGEVEEPVLSKVFQYWRNIDQNIGERIEEAYKKGMGEQVPGADPLNEENVIKEPLEEGDTHAGA